MHQWLEDTPEHMHMLWFGANPPGGREIMARSWRHCWQYSALDHLREKSYKSVSKLANAANAANAFMLRKNHGSLNYSLIGADDTACALNFLGQIGN